ncbi:MAG: aromatic amino acid hydroxylase [Bacteroidetes bacterium]|nr:aromatic amino acid hydroxylase [Bacteroidota bacterium]
MELNDVLKRLPRHLMDLVIDQPYNEYTAQDHALWRYVMRRNVEYLSRVAHGSYLEGLRKTGISIDEIPHMYGMNRILKEIGWAAVAVDGFIPPSAFMEFQAYNVLVIAADIRPIDQLEYTPAPDIIHEAAGHAPIIADEEYAGYLKYFGEIGSRAFSSEADYEQYEAIRHLSILKADPYTSPENIRKAEEKLEQINAHIGPPSEMQLIRNLHWWTVEYGLIGDLNKPRIYGAGLLSSIGESYSALQDDVKKIPYTLDAMNVGFDITTRQPQLFVTPDFPHLTKVLEEFADRMALNNGGVDGILKAIESNHTATVEYSSGLQVSGTFTEVVIHMEKPVYLRTTGPTTLNYQGRILEGHGTEHHHEGFGSPVGKITNSSIPLERMDDADLTHIGMVSGHRCTLHFESGVRVNGKLQEIIRKEGKIILLSFIDCRVTFRERVLFEPSWGIYDMAVGEDIVSAFSGPADPDGFGLRYRIPEEKTHKIIHSHKNQRLHKIYQKIRDVRNHGSGAKTLETSWKEIKQHYPAEWLAPLEILEILHKEKATGNGLEKDILEYLNNLQKNRPELNGLISNGLKLLA